MSYWVKGLLLMVIAAAPLFAPVIPHYNALKCLYFFQKFGFVVTKDELAMIDQAKKITDDELRAAVDPKTFDPKFL